MFLLLSVTAAILQQSFMNNSKGPGAQGDHLWYPVAGSAARGVVVLLHGLNQNPLCWQDMIAFLNDRYLHVMCVRLSGHRGLPFEDMQEVTARKWLAEFQQAYDRAIACSGTLPVYCLGYSMGALIAMIAQMRAGKPLFARQVLLAPALVPKLYTRLAVPIVKVVPLLPSKTVLKYTANKRGTSVAAYEAMFSLEYRLRTGHKPPFLDIPTKIIMHRRDELISYGGTARFIERNSFMAWQLMTLPGGANGVGGARSYRHLVIDRESLGPENWDFVASEIRAHFSF